VIPLCVPQLGGNEWTYVKECLDTGWVSSAGRFVERFERDCASATGAGHAVACTSGTAALTLALRVAGVTAGDLVILPTVTFIAPVNAAMQLGATPLFVDCDDYYNLDAAATLRFLREKTRTQDGRCFDRASGARIGALVPVHVFGNACDLDEVVPLCAELGIPVVEDATESLGTVYTGGRYAGHATGTIGDSGCLSFNGNKIITTGGGGMILTADAETARHARYLSTQAKDDPIYFVHDEAGYNFRLTNLAAAVGCAQLEQLDHHKAAKQAHRAAYAEALHDVPGLSLAPLPPYADNNCWMIAVRVDAERYGTDRDGLLERLRAADIEARPLWHLNHLQRPYRHCPTWHIERAPELLASTVNIPCSVGLGASDRDRVIEALRG